MGKSSRKRPGKQRAGDSRTAPTPKSAAASKPEPKPRRPGRAIAVVIGLVVVAVAAVFVVPALRENKPPELPPTTTPPKVLSPLKVQELPALSLTPQERLVVPNGLDPSQRDAAFQARDGYGAALEAYHRKDIGSFVKIARQAMQQFRRAGWLSEDIATFHTMYVSYLFEGGHAPLAIREVEDWLTRHPNSIHHREALGKLHYRQGRFASAAEHLEFVAKSFPNSLRSQRRLAQVYSSLGNKEKGLAAVERCLRLIAFRPDRYPRSLAADETVSVCLQVSHRFRDYERAAEIATVVLMKRPQDPEALMALGVSERHLGHYDGAIRHLHAYLSVAPKESVNVHFVELDLGIALLKRDRTREAVEVFAALLTREPYSTQACLQLGQALLRLGQTESARRFLERSRRLAPIDREVRRETEFRGTGDGAHADRALALSHRMRGDYAAAEKLLKDGVRSGGVGRQINYIEQLMETVRAADVLGQAEELGKRLGAEHGDSLGWKAMGFHLSGDLTRAAQFFEVASQRGGESLRAWGPLFVRLCLDELKDPARALPWARAVLELGPEPYLKILLARAHFDGGEIEEAWKVLDVLSTGTPGFRTEYGALWLARCRALLQRDLEEAGRDLEALASRASHLPEYHLARAEWLEASGGGAEDARGARARATELESLRQSYRAARQRAASASGGGARAQLVLDAARILHQMGDREGALRDARIAVFAAPRETAALELLDQWLDRPDEIFVRAKVRAELYKLDPARGQPPLVADLVASLLEGAAEPTPSVDTTSSGQPAATPSGSTRVTFRDVASSSGVDFENVCGDATKDFVISVNGAGVGLLDYDLDGDLDIYFVNGSRLEPPFGAGPGSPPPSDALFRNDGGLKFTNVTQEAGVVESDWGCGVTVGDYDNDGDPDIFVTNWGRDRLWRNRGDGTFEDVTTTAGTVDLSWGSSCCFVDYDHDGFLDLFIVNYLEFDPKTIKRRGDDPSCQYKGQQILCGPIGLPPAPCTLYHNRGDGTFEDVSVSSGVRDVDLPEASYSLGIAMGDFDGDGKIDLYVANDTKPNLLFRNQGDGTFEEIGLISGVAVNDNGVAQAGMGVDAVFLGGKKLEDLFVVNYEGDTNTYYSNEGGFFSETTSPMGLATPCFEYLGWGSFFFDCDLDSDLDLFIAQGHVVSQADQIASSPGWLQPNKLFLNDGNGKFVDVSKQAGPGLQIRKSSRGAAYGDLDGDGDADIVINDIDGKATVLENVGAPTNHWLAVRAVGSTSNRSGIGAVVSVELPGGKVLRQRIRTGSSYASHSELVARFGLGDATKIERLSVRWPTGREEIFEVEGVDRVMEVVEGD